MEQSPDNSCQVIAMLERYFFPLKSNALCMSHGSFHSENLEVVRKILFFNHHAEDLIGKHIKIRIQQIKSRKSRNVDTDTQSKIFDKNNTIIYKFF